MSEKRRGEDWLYPVGFGVAIFLLLLFVLGIYELVNGSAAMDNKFSALAREKHMGFLLRENLRVVLAYGLLGGIFCVFVAPIWTYWQKKFPTQKIWVMIARATLLAFMLHGFMLLRLAQTRPYFLSDGELGHWYYQWLQWLPSWLSFVLFTMLPWAAVIAVLFWHFSRQKLLGKIAILILCAALPLFLLLRNTHVGSQESSGSPSQAKMPNIIVIGSDSLRGDRLGYAGYQPKRCDGPAAAGVSPQIDALAARSIVMEKCFTPIASTLESNTSLHSSSYPHTHGFRQMYPSQQTVAATKKSIEPLAAILAKNGYETAAIGDWCAGFYQLIDLGFYDVDVSNFDNFKIYMSQAVIMAHFSIPLYFDNQLGHTIFPEIQSFAQFVTPDVVTRRVEKRIASAAKSDRPFFWHVFYSCNHLPYRSVQPYVSMFADPSYQGKNKTSVDFDINEFIGGTDLEDKWKNLSKEDARQISALYDGCTRQFDECVGRILLALEKNGLQNNTIVVICSDHGDDLYEPGATLGHGLSFHGGDQSNHIPMLLHIPGVKPQRFPQITRSIDLAPTLLDAANLAVPSSWEGQSFFSWVQTAETPIDRPFFAETGFPFIQFRVENIRRPSLPPMDELTFIDDTHDYHFVLKPQYEEPLLHAKERVLRTVRWKLIMTPTAEGGRHFRLFHLPTDPHCQKNLAATHPEVMQSMKQALERWVDAKQEIPIAEIFPSGEPE